MNVSSPAESAPPDEQSLLDAAAARCRAGGATLTPIRRHVLALLHRHPGGLKAYDLLERMKAEHPSASAPTVYRTLDFLIDQGLAHKVGRSNQFVACNQRCHDEASLLLVCPRCGTVTELQDTKAMRALGECLRRSGHILAGPEVEISAVCAACAKDGAPAQ